MKIDDNIDGDDDDNDDNNHNTNNRSWLVQMIIISVLFLSIEVYEHYPENTLTNLSSERMQVKNVSTAFFFFFCVLPVPRRKCVYDRFRFPTV
jgi:hypothetical protein